MENQVTLTIEEISKVKEFSNQRDAEEKAHRDDEIKQQIITNLNNFTNNLK